MKSCPNCRMEARIDADWCWHCGYSYEEAEARARAARLVDDSGSEDMAEGDLGSGAR